MEPGAYCQGLDGEGRRLAAPGTGEHAVISHKKILPAVAAAESVHHVLLRIYTHAAGTEHMGGVEYIIGAVLFKDFLNTAGP